MRRQRFERDERKAQSDVPRRPYVRDTWQARFGAKGAAALRIEFVVLALAIGLVIGFAVFGLMNLSTWLTSLIWDGASVQIGGAWFPLVVCTIGGLAIGVWTYVSGSRISSLEEVMGEFKATGSYRLQSPAKAVVSFLLPLVFGGSIGFEAGLTGIITAACCWIRDRLKAAGLRVGALADVTIAATLSAIFGAPLAGIVAGAESTPDQVAGEPAREDDAVREDGRTREDESRKRRDVEASQYDLDAYDMRRSVKIVLYMAAAIGAFGGIALFSSLFATEAGLPRFEAIQATGAEHLWAILGVVAAYVLAILYHASNYGFARVAQRLEMHPFGAVIAPAIAGVVLGAMATAFPYVLFPGEEQSHELMATWQSWAVVALIGTGALKAVATPMCIRMGWMGGSFFPSIFAGVACGYGLAMLTGADPMLMVTVTTTAYLAAVTRKPLLSVAILALCFPLVGIVWSGLAALVGAALPIPSPLLEVEE